MQWECWKSAFLGVVDYRHCLLCGLDTQTPESKLRKRLHSERKNSRCLGTVEYRHNTKMWKPTDIRLKTEKTHA